MNDWNALRAHYARHAAEIEAEDSNEWAIDPYAWDRGVMTMTPAEQWLWHDIRSEDAVFYPQYPVGRHFVDFANPVAKVAIECDGAQWHTDQAKDAQRDGELRALGWKVYRITGPDCQTDTDAETGAPGAARDFIRRICERHRIARSSRTRYRSKPYDIA
ncbi:MAG TPA: DUF559 domain-containing protein [Pseudorhodoferax sp.]|nr:DUF559 domain-containing protein [Pseudorhodoferax sp.]